MSDCTRGGKFGANTPTVIEPYSKSACAYFTCSTCQQARHFQTPRGPSPILAEMPLRLMKRSKKKYGVDLNDAPSLHSPPPNREHVPAANDDKCDSPHRKPATICQCIADFVDAPASPFAAIGVKSKDFSLKKLHCGRGGACEAMGDVGQTLCEIPRAAADGLVDGLKNTCESASDGPKMAVDGVSKAFRHGPPHSKK